MSLFCALGYYFQRWRWVKINIYKRGKTWTYIVEGPYINNKRNRITKGGYKTKKECEKDAIALEHELNISEHYYKDNKFYTLIYHTHF